jgi:HK97 family phage major capsid protein
MDPTKMAEVIAESVGAAVAPLAEQTKTIGDRLDAIESDRKPVTDNAKGLDESRASAPVVNIGNRARKREVEHFRKRDHFEGRGLEFAAFTRATAIAKRDGTPIEKSLEQMGYPEAASDFRDFKANQKALGEGTVAGGGALVPPNFVADLIENLRAKAVVLAAGPRIVPMPSGTATFPKQTAGVTATYEGENVQVASADQTTGTIELVAKKLIALTPMSNELLFDSQAGIPADQMVRDDLTAALAERADLACLRGDGTQSTPRGLRSWAGNTTTATQAGSIATLDEVIADLNTLEGYLTDNNVMLDESVVWFLAPRSMRFLRALRDGTGGFVFKDEMTQGRLLGHRFFESTQIPTNLGGSTNESEVYISKMTDVLFGETGEMAVETFANAAYYNGSAVVSGVSSDQSVVRAKMRHDMNVRHEESVAYLSAVKWGA